MLCRGTSRRTERSLTDGAGVALVVTGGLLVAGLVADFAEHRLPMPWLTVPNVCA